jgi:hypothetical protein
LGSFAVGRNALWSPLVDCRAKKISREELAKRITATYRE